MKRTLALAVLALAAPAGASAQAPPEFNAKCGQLDCRVERVPAKWQVLSVDSDSRTLNLVYVSGGCRLGDGRATVTETASRIRISVNDGEVVAIDTPDRQVVCTDEIRYRTLRAQLRRPVAGRPIVGDSFVDAGAPRRVPPQRHGGVSFQSPAPGRPAPDRTVGLTLGRHAFQARALRACLREAGIPSTVARPGPDQGEAAPDLELMVQPGPVAFVALYADPARARENAPSIRRNARRFDGSVQRLGRVTIVWVTPPSATLRDGVRACVAGARP